MNSLCEVVKKQACVKCKNFFELTKCSRFFTYNFVTGEKEFLDAHFARTKKYCGTFYPQYFESGETEKVEKVLGFRISKIKQVTN